MYLNVAIVGLGRVGKKRAEVIGRLGVGRIVVIADVDQSRVETTARLLNCEGTKDWTDAVAHPEVDTVIVSTPTKFHATIALAALLQGKHVLCEKPLARTSQEAASVVQLASSRGLKLKAGFNYRHMHHVREAKRLISEGRLGALYLLRCRFGHGGRPGYDQEWYFDPEYSGGGVLLEQGIHILDLVRYLLGEVSEVVAETSTFYYRRSPVEDNASCILKTTANQVAIIHVSWTQWKNLLSLEIHGQDGYLLLNGRSGYYGEQELVWGKKQPDHSTPQEEVFRFVGDDSWDREWLEFVEAIRIGREPLGNGADGIRALQIAEAAYESARSRTWVRLAESS
jgi:predicted dehydrogenase